MASDHPLHPSGNDQTLKVDGNYLLAGLPSSELDGIRPSMERVRPRMRQVLFEQFEPIQYAYFPEGGVFSLLAEMRDRATVETLTVGSEGMIGLHALLGARSSPTRAICRSAAGHYACRLTPSFKQHRAMERCSIGSSAMRRRD
jgi:hypothetical protein